MSNQIESHGPCTSGWFNVLKYNGGVKADRDKEFPLSSILDSNDLDDTLWVLAHLPEYSHLCVEFSRWCASHSIEKIKPYCDSEDDYNIIVHFLETGENYLAAWSAAWSARSAAWSEADCTLEIQIEKLRNVLDGVDTFGFNKE